MPFAKMCAWPGCPEDAEPGQTRCAAHPTVNRKRVYRDKRWAKVRKRVLYRDGFMCTTPGCGATDDLTVDHIDGNYTDPYDAATLRTLCRSCHGRADGGRAGFGGPTGVGSH